MNAAGSLLGGGLLGAPIGSFAALAGAAFTGAVTITSDVGVAHTQMLTLANGASATVGVQKWSPVLRLSASGWKTDATAGAQAVLFDGQLETIQGTASPTAISRFGFIVNGGAQVDVLKLHSSGGVGIGTISTDPGAGFLALPRAGGIVQRNNADGAFLGILSMDAANTITLGGPSTSRMTVGTASGVNTFEASTANNGWSAAHNWGNFAQTQYFMKLADGVLIGGGNDASTTALPFSFRGTVKTGSDVAAPVLSITSGLGTGNTAANMGYLSVLGGKTAGATTTQQTAQEIARFYGTGISVGAGAATTPDASALIDMISTTQALGLPSMTTTQKNAIGTPRAGLLIYDSSLGKACIRVAGAWQTITSA